MNKTVELFNDRIVKNNPVLAKILGICSALAVTNLMENALVMSIGVIFVTAFSEWTVSLLRNYTEKHVRMMVQVMVIAWYVIIVDMALKLYLPDISKALGPYVGLIITNCIIMGRCEAYAQHNKPSQAFLDGVASGTAYAIILLIIAFFRELLGFGSLFRIEILGGWWRNIAVMSMPAGAFFMIGILIWISNTYALKADKRGERQW